MIIVVLLASICFAVLGQVSFKRGMNRVGRIELRSVLDWRSGLFPIVTGFVAYGTSMALWLYTLSRVELSYAFPFVSLSYVAIMLVARLGLGEPVDRHRVIGSVLIVTGVVLVSLTR